MKQTRSLSELSCLSEHTQLYPISGLSILMYGVISFPECEGLNFLQTDYLSRYKLARAYSEESNQSVPPYNLIRLLVFHLEKG